MDEDTKNLAEDLEKNRAPISLQLQDVDKLILELAKCRRLTATAQAEKALAQNETAKIAYENVVLKLYMKYGLSEADAIDETGKILLGGAVPNKQ